MTKGDEYPVSFERLPLRLAGMRWTGVNEKAIQDELAGTKFQAVAPCPGDCPCQAKDFPEVTGEVENGFTGEWQGVETGWWIARLEDGRLFPDRKSTRLNSSHER